MKEQQKLNEKLKEQLKKNEISDEALANLTGNAEDTIKSGFPSIL